MVVVGVFGDVNVDGCCIWVVLFVVVCDCGVIVWGKIGGCCFVVMKFCVCGYDVEYFYDLCV